MIQHALTTTEKTALFKIHPLQQPVAYNAYEYAKRKPDNLFEMIWITKGSNDHWADGQKAAIKNDQLFFVKPGQRHDLEAAEDMEGYVIGFTDSFLDLEDQQSDGTYYNCLFQMLANPEGIAIKNDIVNDLRDITERMMKEFNNVELFRTEILKRYLKIFLLYLTRQFEGSFQITRQTRNIELAQKFLALLDKRFRTQKMVADYAKQLFVTPNYLNEIVKKTTGYPAGYHIRNRIVLEAKRLSRCSDVCMKEIAYGLGFSDTAHFSKFFKMVTGTNFSEFKKEKLSISLVA